MEIKNIEEMIKDKKVYDISVLKFFFEVYDECADLGTLTGLFALVYIHRNHLAKKIIKQTIGKTSVSNQHFLNLFLEYARDIEGRSDHEVLAHNQGALALLKSKVKICFVLLSILKVYRHKVYVENFPEYVGSPTFVVQVINEEEKYFSKN